MSSINIKANLPKSTPQEYKKIIQDSFEGTYQVQSYEDKNALDKAIQQKKTFLFRCEVTADDYSTLKFGKLALIMIGVLLVLLFIFGDFMDPLFLILGIVPLFMMGIVAYGYFNEGRNRVRYKPSWFIVIGAKGLLFRNIEYFEFIEWFQIAKMAENLKKRRNNESDVLGVIFIAMKQQYTLEFYHFDLKAINFQDPIGKTGRDNLMTIIKKYKENATK